MVEENEYLIATVGELNEPDAAGFSNRTHGSSPTRLLTVKDSEGNIVGNPRSIPDSAKVADRWLRSMRLSRIEEWKDGEARVERVGITISLRSLIIWGVLASLLIFGVIGFSTSPNTNGSAANSYKYATPTPEPSRHFFVLPQYNGLRCATWLAMNPSERFDVTGNILNFERNESKSGSSSATPDLIFRFTDATSQTCKNEGLDAYVSDMAYYTYITESGYKP